MIHPPHIGWSGYGGHSNAGGEDLSGNMTLSRPQGVDRLLLAFCNVGISNQQCSSVTIDGVSMHKAKEHFDDPVDRWTYIWYLRDSELPASAGTYAYYMTAPSHTLGISFVELYDVDQVDTINQVAGGDDWSLNVGSVKNNMVLDMNYVWDIYSSAGIYVTPGANQVLISHGQYGNWLGSQSWAMGVTYEIATGTPTTMSQSVDHGAEQGHVGISVGGRPQVHGPRGQNN